MHLKAANLGNMNETGKIFKFQIWRLLSLVALIFAIKLYLSGRPESLRGSFLSISTDIWFWLAVAIPVFYRAPRYVGNIRQYAIDETNDFSHHPGAQ